ncbi:MAG: UDP-N-acetylmuramate dehydrogenase, partial [Bacteroidetes bacterium]|nr:UDP-N-acetylmuramate dehydrogenase [Bacteroidota bacterium]
MSKEKLLRKIIPDLKTEISLAPYTTWNIGGPATFFWEPSYDALPSVIELCTKEKIPVYFLGRGSNVLINENGLDGLVICTKKALQEITFDGNLIHAQSGVPLPKLAKFAAKQGFGGYEFLIGIPGTVGGGIVINAGLTAKKRLEVSDILEEAELLYPDGSLEWKKSEDLGLKYRSSNLLDKNIFVRKARFKSTWFASEKEIRNKIADHLADRRRKQPLGKSTAGSTFKQPEEGRAAGWYIDE